jgi:hypothetical protein
VKPVPENIVSTVIDGVVLFATSSVFWLAVAGWLVILTPVILRRKFSAKKKLKEIMNNLVPVGSPASPGTLLPVAIDYPAALALRQMALVQDELPKYLLAPEVSALLHYVPDLHRKMLLATLWNTGARINEALALTRGFFAGAAVSVRAAGHAQAAYRESDQDGRSCPRRQSDPSSGSPFRSPLCQPAADDGGHPENSAGKTKQAHRQNGEGTYLGDHRPYRAHLA